MNYDWAIAALVAVLAAVAAQAAPMNRFETTEAEMPPIKSIRTRGPRAMIESRSAQDMISSVGGSYRGLDGAGEPLRRISQSQYRTPYHAATPYGSLSSNEFDELDSIGMDAHDLVSLSAKMPRSHSGSALNLAMRPASPRSLRTIQSDLDMLRRADQPRDFDATGRRSRPASPSHLVSGDRYRS